MHNSIPYLLLLLLILNSCAQEEWAGPEKEKDGPLFELLSLDRTRLFFKTSNALPPQDLAGISSGGGGVAAGDINNDGLPDLLFSGGIQNSGLFLNEGDFRFKDITQSAGLVDYRQGDPFTECVNFVDVNGDGWLDIYITKLGIAGNFRTGEFSDFGANLLYINNKNLTFTESAAQYGLDLIGQTIAAQFFDFDNDGDLDVFLIQGPEPGSTFSFSYYQKKPAFKWFRDMMLENRNGRFVDITEQAGILNERNVGLSISIADVNQDGFQDVYVANDFLGRDYFYLNNGDKTFREAFHEYFTKTSMSSMGSDFADVDDDGYDDLFVGEMMPASYRRQKLNLAPFSIEIYERSAREQAPQYTRNMLFRNFRGQKMRDLGLYADVYATEWSWSSFFFDADLDGRKDLFVANGIRRDMTNMDFVKSNFGDEYTSMADPKKQREADLSAIPSVPTQNFIFRNQGDFQFEKQNGAWGFTERFHTRGATYADLDGDGDQEVILNNLDGPPSVYNNLAREKTGRNYLKLRLMAGALNPFGIGSKVEVRLTGGSRHYYALKNQRGFQSTPEPLINVGLGDRNIIDTLIVHWPTGKRTIYFDLKSNTLHTLDVEAAQAWNLPVQQWPVLFEETTLLDFVHREDPYNDFKYERLIPRQYSKPGPQILTGDVNQDGRQDLYLTGGENSAKLFLQKADGTFGVVPNTTAREEHSGILADLNTDGRPEVYLARSGQRQGEAARHQLHRIGEGNLQPLSGILPDINSTISTAAAADIDNDGDLDLFLGAGVQPGAFGVIPRSYLFVFENGKYLEAPDNWSRDLRTPGKVQKAVFSDVNGDERPDLVLAGAWMPVQIYLNRGNGFEKTEVSNSSGLWETIEPADLDGDGDVDFIAGNLGRNHLFRASPDRPLTLLAADFDQSGSVDPVLFYYSDGVRGLFHNRDLFVSQMPVMNNKYFDFSSYAAATYDNVFTAEQRANAREYNVSELETCLLINENGQFKIKRLPPKVQMTNTKAVVTYDFDGDGLLDILLAGNSNQNHYEYGDMDASEGFLLFGRPDGGYQVAYAGDYGLDLSGFVRDLAIIDVNEKPVLVVAQNDGPAKSYRIIEW